MARSGHVYVMDASYGVGDVVKVGFSTDPRRRAATLPGMKLLHETQWLKQADAVERAAHAILIRSGRHIGSEFFRASLDEAIDAIGKAIAQEDEWKKGCKVSRIGQPRKFDPNGPEVASMREMIRKGMSIARVAKAFSVAPATVRNYIPTSEIQKLRPPKEAEE